ncbi:ankyrin repeat domain-containing protein [Sediminibacter sp. Hel_I_10]|uniref:ankyrin repeat domain-containing protein n=1 Tax=Sediminibacter sp. Hel_I_10 TaxID=1392490 RepID=UPI0012DF77DD|nr:ankyrin repeat domain-containing protein [Sediminibacter sp. Hel_I_10]
MSMFKGLFSSNKSEINLEVQLFRALFEPNKQKVIDMIKKGKINLNAYRDNYSNTILINAVNCGSEFQGNNDQLELIHYLLDHKVNVNYINDNGFNALHIALANHNLSKVALLLLKKGNPNVNDVERKHGNSPIFTAIREYGLTLREEQKEVNQLRFEIIDELLNRGAELNKKNKHGINAGTWLENIPKQDKLHKLINDYDGK